MRDRKDVEKEVRRWLDHTVTKCAYDAGVLAILTNLYFEGGQHVRDEIKNALGVRDCICE